MGALGFLLSNFARLTYLDNLETQLTAEAKMIGEILKPILQQSSAENGLDDFARKWANIINGRVTIIAPDGTVLGESHEDRTAMNNHLDRPEIVAALNSGYGTSTRFSHTVGYQMMYTAIQLKENGQKVGFVRIAIPVDKLDEKLNELQLVLVTTTLFITLLAVLLASLISIRISNPLRQLTREILRITNNSPASETRLSRGNEIGQLSQAFNTMSLKIKSQITEIETESAKLSAVLQKMNDGVLIVDGVGNVQLINPAAARLFPRANGTGFGSTLIEVTMDHQPVDLWKKCLESGESQSAKFEISNNKTQVLATATILGSILPDSILLLFQDITKQVQTEAIRRDFISNVSHELRTPLAGIKALTETLQTGALEDPPAARRFLERIETEVDSLSLMVSELLELSKIESGRVPFEFRPTKPIEVIKPAYDRLFMQAEHSCVSLQIHCSEDLPEINADAVRLQQVMVNLIHNAIKFTAEGGTVTVKASVKEKYVKFSVEDTGVGISSEDIPRIFERFYKADRSRASTGTGLGLAIARHTVESHSGHIWVDSGVAKGSIFSFIIPIL
jgi:two-component system phosphate regulon sensor histidine kinase PhoR